MADGLPPCATSLDTALLLLPESLPCCSGFFPWKTRRSLLRGARVSPLLGAPLVPRCAKLVSSVRHLGSSVPVAQRRPLLTLAEGAFAPHSPYEGK